MLHALGTTAVDPHVQALFERETSEAPPDEATRAGDQNLHRHPLPLILVVAAL